MEIARLEKRLADRKITMAITDNALDYLSDVGFDPVYGARPLKRTIQRELETNVAKGILRGDFTDGDNIIVDSTADGITVIKSMDVPVTDFTPSPPSLSSGSFE